jgi:phage tail sheath protein FI
MTVYNHPGVYINELPLAVTTNAFGYSAVASGAIVAQFAKGPTTITRVTSYSQFEDKFGSLNGSYPATYSVKMFFNNGGTDLYVRRVVAANAPQATADIFDTNATAKKIATIRAKYKGNDSTKLRVKTDNRVTIGGKDYYDFHVYFDTDTADGAAGDAGFQTRASLNTEIERFNSISFDQPDSSSYLKTVLALSSNHVEVNGTIESITATKVMDDKYYPLTGVESTTPLTKFDYTGDLGSPALGTVASYSVFNEYNVVDCPLVFMLPDVNKFFSTQADAQSVFNALIAWSEVNTSRFVIIDTPADLSVSSANTFASGLSVSSRAAVYYPQVFIKDTSISGSPLRKIGPAGAVAGLYLFNDRKAGPYKTPAGIGAKVQDALAIEKLLTNEDLDALNNSTYPLNAIRNVPGAGIVVMGGRTLKQDGTANRYISMRRSLTYIEKSLSDLTQFAVFESNSEILWSRITTTLSAFLNTYRNQGGLRGATPQDAFFVTCDATNNSAQSISNGIVNVDVGVALEYPGEFVIINLSQIVGQ